MSTNEFYSHSDTSETAERYDRFNALPQLPPLTGPGSVSSLVEFLQSKNLYREDLLRIGTRIDTLRGEMALAWLFPDGIKRRGIVSGARESEAGVTWTRSKLVHSNAGPGVAKEVILAEGETDGAFLSRIAGATCDVAILPAGCKFVPPGDDWSTYDRVYVALDNDEPGHEGAQKFLDKWDNAVRVLPPEGAVDWCESGLSTVWDPASQVVLPPKRVYSVREVLATDFGDEADNHWFKNGIVPLRGSVALHGPMKSLKSVVAMELIRALTTATEFAGYVPFIHERAARCLLIQFEIAPYELQRRLLTLKPTMDAVSWDLFQDNLTMLGIGDGALPRLKIADAGFTSTVLRAVEEAHADVVVFDPLQRMTGGASLDKAHEMEPMFDLIARLQGMGLTVVFSHHNNKSMANESSPYGMSGTQRFGADVDSICSLSHNKAMLPDDNSDGIKQRNFAWELRNGTCGGRSVTSKPNSHDPSIMDVTFDEPVTSEAATTVAPAVPTSAGGAVPPPIF